MENIIQTLVIASEKAAAVARACCVPESDKNALLVTVKTEEQANPRFEKDFKTIADVLAQECAKAEIIARFPKLAKHVRGEECPEINGIPILAQETFDETVFLLNTLVPSHLATHMAQAAHESIKSEICSSLPTDLPEINIDDLGIWIDPIDATAEFVAGVQGKSDAQKGLPCVTVLIGAYRKSSGEPILGVVNQPFHNDGKGLLIWGISYGDYKKWGIINNSHGTTESNKILVSSAERREVTDKIKNAGWNVESLPGAGHKLLKVILGEAAAYILSKDSTFHWDTCGPHAILKARGGDILSFIKCTPLNYKGSDKMLENNKNQCNSEGIIAYLSNATLEKLKPLRDQA